MAKFNVADMGRTDCYTLNPAEIVVNEKSNGRWEPHDDNAIMELVQSFEEMGQLQPVTIRKTADNKPELVLGFRRYRAAVKFNELHPEKPMRLKCVLTSVNAEEAFLRNLAENKERKETSPMDDAFNQRRLREEYGWKDTKIAQFYKCSNAHVSQLKKLLALTTPIQQKVHKRELSGQAALALSDLTEEEQSEIVSDDEDIDNQEVIKKVRQKKSAKGDKQSRSPSEVRSYLESLAMATDGKVSELAKSLVEYWTGGLQERDMTTRLYEICGQKMPAKEKVKTVKNAAKVDAGEEKNTADIRIETEQDQKEGWGADVIRGKGDDETILYRSGWYQDEAGAREEAEKWIAGQMF